MSTCKQSKDTKAQAISVWKHRKLQKEKERQKELENFLDEGISLTYASILAAEDMEDKELPF